MFFGFYFFFSSILHFFFFTWTFLPLLFFEVLFFVPLDYSFLLFFFSPLLPLWLFVFFFCCCCHGCVLTRSLLRVFSSLSVLLFALLWSVSVLTSILDNCDSPFI